MNKKIYTTIFSICLFVLTTKAQTVLYTQDFETGAPDWSLNTADLGGDQSGADNEWLLNNVYLGGTILSGLITIPNTPDEPSGIPGFPHSNYIHICSALAEGDGVLNTNFYAGGANSYFTSMDSISTFGLSGVSISFWWLCNGNANNAVGEVYYRTSATGSWNILNNPANGQNHFSLNSNWTQAIITNAGFDNQHYIQFGVRFRNNISGNDPAFAVDHFVVTYSGAAAPAPVASFSLSPSTGAGCPGDCFDFTSTSTNNPTSVAWSFPGGTPANSTSTTPHVCFALQGSYPVTLIATNASGSDTITTLAAVTINPAPPVPSITVVGNVLTANAVGVSYQWKINNANIGGATSQSYTITQSGYYQVMVTNQFGCSNISDSTFVTWVNGVNEAFGNNTVSIFPNPVNDKINIHLQNSATVSVSVSDVTGRVVYEVLINGNEAEIPSSNFPNGIYIVKLNDGKASLLTKIVKQ